MIPNCRIKFKMGLGSYEDGVAPKALRALEEAYFEVKLGDSNNSRVGRTGCAKIVTAAKKSKLVIEVGGLR